MMNPKSDYISVTLTFDSERKLPVNQGCRGMRFPMGIPMVWVWDG